MPILPDLQVLQQLSAPDNAPRFGCPLYSYRFVSGQCLMDISGSNTFKVCTCNGLANNVTSVSRHATGRQAQHSGHCNELTWELLLAFAHLSQYASHPSRRNVARGVMGNIGIAPFPGSDVVLDWESQKLMPCTPQLCPYATR